MNKKIIFITIIAFSIICYYFEKALPNKTKTTTIKRAEKLDQTKPPEEKLKANIKNEQIKPNLKSFTYFYTEFSKKESEVLQDHLLEIENEITNSKLLEEANRRRLTKGEHLRLTKLLRMVDAINTVQIERLL